MSQTRSLSVIQRFPGSLGHRALHIRGNSAAVESFAASGHDGKDADVGVFTFEIQQSTQLISRNCEPRPMSRLIILGLCLVGRPSV
jgi:hypothetical protein